MRPTQRLSPLLSSKFSWLFLGIFGGSLFGGQQAFACPDVSGTYQTPAGVLIRFQQQECQSLRRDLGENLTSPLIFDKIFFANTANCSSFGSCETVSFNADSLSFTLNFQAQVSTEKHGECLYSSFLLKKDSQGFLLRQLQAAACQDAYRGSLTETLRPL